MIEAWTLIPGQVLDVPTKGVKMIMAVDHKPRFDAVFLTFDDGFTVRILPGALVRTL